ncbi:WASH complex subunit 4 isoform X1 [Drosophila serrata]|uniref:WASH complex subunit 4 isoform X1 n=2 Tax=Drosophila serrata TaxID=7274 RepID=UPI000A1D2CFD|nr:WASH complex subunit 4 isoform X1 [Drosophila serrata]
MKQEQSPLSIFAEDILKNYGSFMEEHDDKLKLLSNKLPISQPSDSVSPISMTPVIELNVGRNESSTVSEMSFEESELLANKTLTTLANLCNQCRDLAHTARQYQLAFMFSDFRLLDDVRSTPSSDGAGLEGPLFRMSGSMEFFCQVFFLLKRIVVVLQNLWRQISSAADSVPVSNIFTVFDCMTELLEHAVVFSELAIQSKISVKWTLYKEWLVTLSNAGHTAGRCSGFELAGLRTSLAEIESVIAGNLFGHLLDSLLDLKKQFKPKDVSYISQQSNAYIRKMLLQIDGNQNNEFVNLEEPKHLIRLVAFVAVHHELGIQIEAKLVRNVTDLVNRHHRLPLNQTVYWSPAAFLAQHAKTLMKTPAKPVDFQGVKAHSSVLEKMKSSDLKTCRQLGVQISLWSISMQRVLDAGVFGRLKTFSQLILSGQSYAEQVTRLADSLVNRHMALMTPLSKTDWFVLCRLLQYLKVLQRTFESNQIDFVRFTSSLIQWQKQRVLHLLQTTRKKIVDLKLLQRKVNFLSTMKLAEKSILGFPSKKRLTFIDLAVGEFLDKDRILPADKLKVFPSILQRANNLNSFGIDMRQQLDSSSLIYNYWFLSTSLLKEFTELQHNPYALQNLVAVSHHLDKSMAIFGSSELSPPKPSANRLMIEFLRTHLELFLRMETLSHLFQSQENPFQQNALDYRHCIHASAVEYRGDYNIIRDNLENYFTATFYNLTTIAPHDWKTYEKMRHFASKVLHLRPIDDHLPNQIIDQGIDVLQIMRNIHTFASTYSYNMNLQLFVETYSKGKHLDIIGTRHVANSVQTHGSGIINTTVNFIYQFLRQKFYTFSTFLHDEQIKSRLLKELRFHAEHKHSKPYQSYPYERAENFLRKIRKLGFANNGETYIDLFRKVITQVGNAVGYVRLLQAGSKNANYRSRSYMPKLGSQFSAEEEPKGLMDATASSIREYEKSVGHMRECYSGNTNYFKLLVQGFKPFLCNPHNHHLKTFFLITPALIMNYIDYRVKEKLKIHQKDLSKLSLFEDGFAVGLVYILSMLNQQSEFHELGWSQTTAQQLREQRAKVRNLLAGQQATATPTNEKLSQTMAITEHHVNAYEHEYNLLYATLSSSEIFFQ